MGIDSGFASNGFVDDREEQARWSVIDDKLSNPEPKSDSHIDGKLEMEAKTKDWEGDLAGLYKKELAQRNGSGLTFWQRNKQQIFDALIVLGVIYVGYKLLWEKEDGEGGFDEGGQVSYEAPPQAPPPPPQPAPQPSVDAGTDTNSMG